MQTRIGRRWRAMMLTGGVLTLAMAEAPSAAPVTTETKIRLMASALRARDAGELAAARRHAEELRALLPNDANVSRLLAEIDKLDTAPPSAAAGPPLKTFPPSAAPAPGAAELEAEADVLAQEEAGRITALVAAAPGRSEEARRLAVEGRKREAVELLDRALAELPLNPLTQSAIRGLEETKAAVEKVVVARPVVMSTTRVAPVTEERAELAQQVAKGRSQYLAGDLEAGQATLRAVEAREPGHAEARRLLARIEQDLAAADERTRVRTGAELMQDVNRSWRRPGKISGSETGRDAAEAAEPLARKLDEIVLPRVSFTRAEIGQVVATLGALAEESDSTGAGPKGVNIVLLDPSNKAPRVTLTLNPTPLRRVLDFVVEAIGYQYEVQPDAVVLRPGGEGPVLDTRFFAVTRATVLRLTGAGAAVSASPTKPVLSAAGAGNELAVSPGGDGGAVKAFLQQAGVNFDTVPGSNLAYDGSALIVTQTPRNLERIRNILNRYNDVRQVEIEAKFMEVQQGALEELGVNWTIAQKATQHSGADATYRSSARSLAGAFGSATGSAQGRIVRPASTVETADGGVAATEPLDIPIVNNAPRIPGAAELGAAAAPFATISGVVGEFDVTAVVRALSQKQGTDLLSAPKVTVLSGNPATITVAQEMRYPRSFGQTQSQVGTGNASGGGSAGVAITAGTPQDFTARNVGVELKVTPTVEEDDYSISLDLNPKVTEFDGFVEYGGSSIAISGSTTVTVPSGFYQPIFSVRDISTKVTIWDGATLVMGGLTREEVKTVNDKVPILGDIPILGRAFRSKGESAQKRNLLIFVTANLVNPGGGLKQQRLRRETASAVRANTPAPEKRGGDAQGAAGAIEGGR